jgi:hypothetical protein
MKASILTAALGLVLAAAAFGQQPAPARNKTDGSVQRATTTTSIPAPTTPAQPTTPPGSMADAKVYESGAVLPGPTPPNELEEATVELPTEPIEPYLLTKEAGPFMVLAHTFRGPDAARYALALVLELRRDHNMPAWVFYPKVQPMHSNIRNIPPTSPNYVNSAQLPMPERARIYDEAAVLVGNCHTIAESQKLLNRVKWIKPKCFKGMPNMMPWREGKGLSRALRTTNPLVPAQFLYPSKGDPIIKQMNSGPFSVFNCPGRYTLEVCEFNGRASFDPKDTNFSSESRLAQSPLMAAGERAQTLAEVLAKDPDIVKTGYKPYVYHDRYSSKVMLGSFNTPDDPAAASLRQMLLSKDSGPLHGRVLIATKGIVMAPAPQLTDLQELPH